MKKMKLFAPALIAGIMDHFAAPRGIVLANELGLELSGGRETLLVDPNQTVPVTSKNLVYMRGTSGYQYGMLASGLATLAAMPLGVSDDAPWQAGDLFAVKRFGGTPGTLLGQSLGAITIDHLVYSAANGLIGDLNTAPNGTYWAIGRATKTVAAASQDISFVPDFPWLLTVTTGAFTNPTNPL